MPEAHQPGTIYEGKNPIIDGRRRCGAQLRRKPGRHCMATQIMANGRCRLHGGLTPHGIASPNFITGRYSKYMPRGLGAKYQEAIADPKLLELGNEIGLVQALLEERMEKIYSGETEDFWEYAKGLFAGLEEAMDAEEPDAKELRRLRVLMRNTLSRGLVSFKAYEAVQPIVEQRRKLAESENKRLKDLQATVTMQQALGIINLLISIVKTHITDEKVLAAISEDLARTISPGTPELNV